MESKLGKLGQWFESLPDKLHAKRKLIWLALVAWIGLMVPGMAMFEMDLSDEQFFHQNDPVRQAYDEFRALFGGDESVYIVYRAKKGDVFGEKALRAVYELQEELLNYRLQLKPGEASPLDHMVNITSLINAYYLEASNNALISRPFIGQNIPSDKTKRLALKKAALEHPDYPNQLVSKDGNYGAILIRTDFRAIPSNTGGFGDGDAFDVTSASIETLEVGDDKEPVKYPVPELAEYSAFMNQVYAIINQPKYAGVLEYYPVGAPVINSWVMDTMLPQVNFWTMMSLLLIIVISWTLFRSLSAVIWPLVIIGISAFTVVAILGWLGIRMNMMINVVILLVLAVGVADAIHILSGYIFFRNNGHDHRDALRLTYRKSGVAVTLTSITTGVGMLALLLVPLIPIQHFGLSAAIGVFTAWILSLAVLPVMLDLWAPKKKTATPGKHHLIQRLLRKIEHWGHMRPGLNIAVFAVIGLILIGGVLKVRVDTNFIELFAEGTSVRTSQEVVEKTMGGTMALEIMIRTKTEGALLDPKLLNTMDSVQQWLHQTYPDLVVKTQSLVDVVKSSNQSLNGGRKNEYRIPQDPNVLRQTLFMFSNANPAERQRVVSDDYRQAHITVVFKGRGTREYMVLLDNIENHLESAFKDLKQVYPNLTITPTGGMTTMVRVINYISWSQIKGFGMALLAISLILFITFRSFRVGLIALFPNLFPLIVIFGLMGYLDIPVDTDTLLVAPIMIGIVVDDTIHFLTHYRALIEEHGDIDKAIVGSFREVGQAITFTSIILLGAFVCFMFLDHQGLKHFGILASIAMFAALAGDLLLLPALLKATRTRFNLKPNDTQLSSANA